MKRCVVERRKERCNQVGVRSIWSWAERTQGQRGQEDKRRREVVSSAFANQSYLLITPLLPRGTTPSTFSAVYQ
jgi:hypothetical protein